MENATEKTLNSKLETLNKPKIQNSKPYDLGKGRTVENATEKTLNPKLETLNKPKIQNSKPYDLGERTLNFAKRTIVYVNILPKKLSNIEVGRQLIRSAGSVGANYIEAEDALSKKDFVMRIKISRKESKESKLR